MFSNTIKTVLKIYQKYVENGVWFGTGCVSFKREVSFFSSYPYVWIIIIYQKCTMVRTHLLWRRKKYIKWKRISRVIIGTAKWQTFQQNIHSSYFLWRESKETTHSKNRWSQGNLQRHNARAMFNYNEFSLCKKKVAQNRFHNIALHVIVVKSQQLFDTPEKLQQQF